MIKQRSNNGRSLKTNSTNSTAGYAASGSVVGIAATTLLLSSTIGSMVVVSAGAFIGAKLAVEHGPKLASRFTSADADKK